MTTRATDLEKYGWHVDDCIDGCVCGLAEAVERAKALEARAEAAEKELAGVRAALERGLDLISEAADEVEAWSDEDVEANGSDHRFATLAHQLRRFSEAAEIPSATPTPAEPIAGTRPHTIVVDDPAEPAANPLPPPENRYKTAPAPGNGTALIKGNGPSLEYGGPEGGPVKARFTLEEIRAAVRRVLPLQSEVHGVADAVLDALERKP